MICYEMSKLLRFKVLFIFLAILLAVNGLLAYFSAERNELFFHLQTVEEAYQADPEGTEAYFAELSTQYVIYNDQLDAFFMGVLPEEPIWSPPCTYSQDTVYDDHALLHDYFLLEDANTYFQSDLKRVIIRAEADKKELYASYTGLNEDTFAIKRLTYRADLYSKVAKNAEIKPEMGYGWDQFFDFEAVNLFIFVGILMGAGMILPEPADAMRGMIRTTRRGRCRTALSKLAMLALYTIALVLLFMASTWLGTLLKTGGYSSISNSMAVFYDYQLMPYSFTVGSYLLFSVGMKCAAFFVMALITSLACILFRLPIAGSLVSFAICAIQFVLYLISPSEMVSSLNLVGIALVRPIVEDFHVFAILKQAILYLPFSLYLLGVLIVILSTLSVILYTKLRGTGSTRKMLDLRFLTKRFDRIHRKSRSLCQFPYESAKTLAKRSSILLILVMLIAQIALVQSTTQPTSDYDAILCAEYFEKMEGMTDEERLIFLESEQAEMTKAESEYKTTQTAYFEGALMLSEFQTYLDSYYRAQTYLPTVEKLLDHARYLSDVQTDKGIDAGWLNDWDWNRLFEGIPQAIPILLVVYLASDIFACDRDAESILQTTKFGRKRRFFTKIGWTLTLSVALTLAFTGIEYAFAVANLNLPSISAPLVSLERFSATDSAISIGVFLAVMLVQRLVFTTLLALSVAELGCFMKNRLFAFVLGILLAFGPRVLCALGVQSAAYVDLYGAIEGVPLYLTSSALALGDFAWTLILGGACLIIVALLTIEAYRKFSHNARRQS